MTTNGINAGAGDLSIELGGHELTLRPDRSVAWSEERTVFVADVHLGKDQVFRRSGVPIPADVLTAELQALTTLLDATLPERLVVLGDWIHAAPADDESWPHAIGRWRARHAQLELVLVAGNHDRGLRPWLARWNMQDWPDGKAIQGLGLMHESDLNDPTPGLSGHVHPVVKIGRRQDRVRLPAFARKNDHLILPAFGRFTGGGEGLDRDGWSFYPVTTERVFDPGGHPAGDRSGRAAG